MITTYAVRVGSWPTENLTKQGANQMKHYYVDVNGGMAIVNAKTLESAKRFSTHYFGAIHVRFVRLATDEEIDWYKAMEGIIHEANNVSV